MITLDNVNMIVSNMFKKLNTYFIADEGEEIPVSDYLYFYGTVSLAIIIGFIFFALNIITIFQ